MFSGNVGAAAGVCMNGGVLTRPMCCSMMCADRHYGGSLFPDFGTLAGTAVGICVVNGVAGYCDQGALASFMSPTGSDEFDIDAPPIQLAPPSTDNPEGIYYYPGAGLDFTPAGSPTTGPNGEVVVGTGSLGFSDLLWSAANIKNDNVLQLPPATTSKLWAQNHAEIQAAINEEYLWAASPGLATNQSLGVTATAPVTVNGQPITPWPWFPGWWFTGQ
jgi:hypothetical protein